MEYTPEIDELIAKHLSGEIAATERERLQHWLAESADHRQYFSQMEKLWQRSSVGQFSLKAPLDVEAALVQTKAKIQRETPKIAKKVSFSFWRYGLAAALALLIAAVWFFQNNDPSPTLFATSNDTLRDTLTDGSMVSLNRHSSLSVAIGNKTRRVKMRGKAYFEVAPNREKPFVIEVDAVEVTVLGTKFDIDDQSDPDYIVVSVEEGKVQVKSGSQTEYFTAGEQARIRHQNGQIARQQMKPTSNVTAWANRRFVFDDLPLSEVIPQLEATYNVQITLKNKELEQCRLYVRFNNESIENILKVIAETFSFKLERVNGQYFLDGASCAH